MLRVLMSAFLALCVGLNAAAAQDAAKKEAPKKPDAAKGEKVKKQLTDEEKAAMLEKMFTRLDKNGDKKLSFDELKGKQSDAKKLEALEKRFKAQDKDGDKSLSLEEFKAAPEKKPRGKKEKKPAEKK